MQVSTRTSTKQISSSRRGIVSMVLMMVLSVSSLVSWGQTNPTAFNLSGGNFSFTTQTATNTAYPTNIQGWNNGGTANLATLSTAASTADIALQPSATVSTTSIGNLGANGFQFLSSGSATNSASTTGAIAIALNATGRQNLLVTWTAQDLSTGSTRQMNLTLQYRLATTGAFTTVSSSTYTTSNSAQLAAQTFTNVALPSACDNQALVQIRWLYYESAAQAGGRDAVRLDDISVSSSAQTPTISTTGTLTARSTTYGTASSATSFSVSGTTITGGILVTPPAGYEVSQTAGGASGYASTQTVGGTGTVSATTVYVRIAALTAVGTISTANVVCTSSGATTQNVSMPSSTVSAKGLTISGLTGSNKEYDRTTTASYTGTAILNGVEAADAGNVTLSGTPSASFATAAIGTAKPITVIGFTLNGTAAGNYSVSQPTGLTGNIISKNLTISGVTANDKTFDNNTTATLAGTATLNGVVSGDEANVTLSGTPTATFASSAVGTNIAVTVTGYTLSGTASGNYTLSQPSGLTANITSSGLTDQTITFGSLSPVTYGDADFNLTATASSGLTVAYSSSNTSVATVTGNTVHIVGFGSTTITASQDGDGTYNPAPDVTQSLTVSKKALTVSGATASSKEYNRTTSATITGGSLVGVVTGDIANVSLTQGAGTGTFASANVGTGISVTAALSISGSASSNYTLTQPTGLTADITAKNLTISGISAANKAYNGNTDAALSGTATLNGVVSGDGANVTLGGSPVGTFASANIGTGISVSVSGYSISGSASGNYTLSQPSGLSANITAKALTVSGLTADNKVYDRTTAATYTGTATLNGVVSGEEANVSLGGTGSASFATASAGNGKTVNVTGYSISGSASGNYTLSALALTANITQAPLTITGVTANNKTYNNSTAATLSGTPALSGVVAGDESDVSVSGTAVATFADANVGTGIAVTVTGYTLSGTAAGNYSVSQPTGLTADITKANQTITFNAIASKITGDAPFTVTLNSSAGLAISYSSSNTSVATVSGNTITIVGAGTSTITASQAGNSNFNAATNVDQTLTVQAAIAKWTFDAVTVSGTATTPTISSSVADLGDQTTGSQVTGAHASSLSAWTTATGNGSTKSISTDHFAAGDYWQFKVNTSSYSNISVKWDQRGSNTGPRDFKIQYSTNGTTFTDFNTFTTPNNAGAAISWSAGTAVTTTALTFDLSAITAINNAATVYFRLTVAVGSVAVNGGAIGTGGTSNIDNFTVIGQACTPASFNVTGGGAYCAGGSGSVVGLDGSATGVNYQLKNGASNVGSPVSGTGSAISFGGQTAAGTYTVVATNASTGCTATMTGNAVVSVTTTAAPTGSASQSFCHSGSVSDLTATGTSVVWFDASTGGTLLSGTDALVNGSHYYASQTISGCESNSRLDVTVTITNPSAPTGSGSQTFCNAAAVADLSATGTAIKWYDAASGGTLLSGTDALVNGSHYYATQTIAGCESTSRLDVTVTVNVTSTPTGSSSQNFCYAGTVADLTATGSNIKWYDAASGGTLLSGTDALVNGTHYYASQTISGCESASRLDITVTITSPAAPTGSASQSFCYSGTVADLVAGGSGIQWYSSSTGGSPLSGATALVNGNHYYATQTVGSCESNTRLNVTVAINNNPVVSAITGSTLVVIANTTQLSNTTPGGTWSSDDDGIASVDTDGLVSGVALGSTTINYTVTNGCGSTSVHQSMTVVPDCYFTVADSIVGTRNACSGFGTSTANVTYSIATTDANAYNWTVSNPGTMTIVSGQNTNSVEVHYGSTFVSGTISVTISSLCGDDITRITNTITKTNPAVPAAINGPASACAYLGGSEAVYSVNPVSGASFYRWTLPATMTLVSANADSSSIHVTFNAGFETAAIAARTLKVKSVSGCGNSADKSIVIVGLKPAAPTGITIQPIQTNVCGARIYRYIAPVAPAASTTLAAATGYSWSFTGTLGTNATIDSGSLSSRIVVMRYTSNAAAAIGDSVKLAFTSDCGNSNVKAMKLNNAAISAPAAPSSITISAIQTNVCGARIYRYTAPALPAATTTAMAATGYSWSFTGTLGANASIDSGTLSSRAIVVRYTSNAAATIGDSVKVLYTSACGDGKIKAAKLSNAALNTPLAPTAITQTLVLNNCGARVYRYSAPALPGATATVGAATGYAWTLPEGPVGSTGTLDSGTVSSRVIRIIYTSNAAASAGDSIRVAYTSDCGLGKVKAAKLSNGALGVPAAPAAITQTLVLNDCGARVYRYTAPVLPNGTLTAGAATGYVWTMPEGPLGTTGMLDSGTVNSRVIRVIYTSNAAALAGDTIRLAYNSDCGMSKVKAFKLTILAKAGCTTPPPAKTTEPLITKVVTGIQPITQNKMEANVFPNPSTSSFRLQVNTSAKEMIHVRILDRMGRTFKQTTIMPGETFNFGSELKTGTYIVEIMQGSQRTTQQIIKL